jgi:uncharacterized protein DUF998
MRERQHNLVYRVALAGLLTFVAIVALQHALVPRLTPDRHTISEYANARASWLMVAGFVAWAASLLATAALVRGDRPATRRAVGHVVLAALLLVAAAGVLLTALFATQTSAGALPPGARLTASGRIHDLASGGVSLALLPAVGVSIAALSRRGRFPWTTAALLVLAIVGGGVLLAVGDPVDGIRQRLLVVVACAWQAALILTLWRPPTASDS